MANYATNNFFAQTENEKDLITIEQFIEENFCDSNIAKHQIKTGLCTRMKNSPTL